MRSSVGTPTIGIRRTCAIIRAVVTPTRRPVNKPGPSPTATNASWCRSTSSSRHRYSIAGASCSACRRPPSRLRSPSTWPSRPSATLTRGVAVSIARTSTQASPSTARAQRAWPDRPTTGPAPCSSITRVSSSASSGGSSISATSSRSVRQQRAHRFAPLHHGHRVAVEQLVEPEVDDLLEVVEAVDVEVEQRHVAFVLAHDRERRAHHRLGHARARRRSPSRARSCPRRGHRRARRRRRTGATPRAAGPSASVSSADRVHTSIKCSPGAGEGALDRHEVGAGRRQARAGVAQHRRRDAGPG